MPKRFQFRLEPLLKLRANAVEQAKNALATALQHRIKKEEEFKAREQYFNQLLVSEQNQKQTIIEMQAHWHHRQTVQHEIRTLEREKNKLLDIEQKKRDQLAEAMKQEKTVEKLKERKKIEYQESIAKEEQIFMDEIAGRGHGKSSSIRR
jgi:flagellar export protein FliJ